MKGILSKPALSLKTTGTRPVHGFSFRYYINTESGFNPIIDKYYTPNAHISIENYGNDATLCGMMFRE
jgi:hypothetical protein